MNSTTIAGTPLEKFVSHSVHLHLIFTSHTKQILPTLFNNLLLGVRAGARDNTRMRY